MKGLGFFAQRKATGVSELSPQTIATIFFFFFGGGRGFPFQTTHALGFVQTYSSHPNARLPSQNRHALPGGRGVDPEAGSPGAGRECQCGGRRENLAGGWGISKRLAYEVLDGPEKTGMG